METTQLKTADSQGDQRPNPLLGRYYRKDYDTVYQMVEDNQATPEEVCVVLVHAIVHQDQQFVAKLAGGVDLETPIEHNGATCTLLGHAMQRHQNGIAKVLLDYGADPVGGIYQAVMSENFEGTKLLFQRGLQLSDDLKKDLKKLVCDLYPHYPRIQGKFTYIIDHPERIAENSDPNKVLSWKDVRRLYENKNYHGRV